MEEYKGPDYYIAGKGWDTTQTAARSHFDLGYDNIVAIRYPHAYYLCTDHLPGVETVDHVVPRGDTREVCFSSVTGEPRSRLIHILFEKLGLRTAEFTNYDPMPWFPQIGCYGTKDRQCPRDAEFWAIHNINGYTLPYVPVCDRHARVYKQWFPEMPVLVIEKSEK